MGGGGWKLVVGVWLCCTASYNVPVLCCSLQVWGDLAELLRHSLLPLLRRGKTKIVLY